MTIQDVPFGVVDWSKVPPTKHPGITETLIGARLKWGISAFVWWSIRRGMKRIIGASGGMSCWYWKECWLRSLRMGRKKHCSRE